MTAGRPTPRSALAIGAHPDDVEFGAGATLARWASLGCEVHLAVCTDGSKGTWDPTADLAQLVERRQDEQREAAAAIGAVDDVIFLGRVDGELEEDRDTRSDLARIIRQVRPEIVLGHDPWQRYRLHPDHRHAGFLTVDAVVAARDPHFFPEHGLPHHRPQELMLFEADQPDHIERVDAEHLDAKVRALMAHRSQLESTHFHRLDDPNIAEKGLDAATAEFRELQRREILLADGTLGEHFRRLDDL